MVKIKIKTLKREFLDKNKPKIYKK